MPRRLSQADWNRFHNAAAKRAERIMRAYAGGDLTISEWTEKFTSFVEDRHGYAAYMGRRRGGDFTPRHDGDRDFGRLAAESQHPFIDRFAEDLRSGRYISEETG